MQRLSPLALVFLVVLALASSGGVAHAAGSSSLVVSQVYGGGGNAGATFDNDYVEVFNRGDTTVDLSTWSIQYAPATGTTWQATALGGTLAPGHYYLLQLGTTGTTGATLPVPDGVDTTNVSASGGKIALVHALGALTCGATAGSCAAAANVADLVGYGTATDAEGTAAPAGSATTALVRAGAGCTDTDQNAADFTASTPAPHNSSSTAASCGGTTAGAPTQQASVDVDVQPVLSLSLERSSLSFGSVTTGSQPAAVAEHVTVFSNRSTGYALSVHRSAFAPADLPLGVASSAAAGGTLGASLAGGVTAPLPIAPAADLLIGTTAAASPAAGDVWPAAVGFTGPLPAVTPGHYTASLTFTVIGR